MSPPKPDSGLPPVFVITVDDPQKVGDPIRPFTMYTVHTRVGYAYPFSVAYAHLVLADNLPSLPEIRVLRPQALLRLCLAIRDTLSQQPRGGCAPSSREECVWSI